MPFWNPPSGLIASGPSPAHPHQTVDTSTGMPQAEHLAGQGHGPTHQKASWDHRHPSTWPYQPESPGLSPTHQCTGTTPGTLWALQPETPGPSSTHQWAGTSPMTTTTLQTAMERDNHFTSRPIPVLTPGSGPTHQPANTSIMTSWTPHPAVSGHKPTYQWSDTRSGTPGLWNQRPQDQALSTWH